MKSRTIQPSSSKIKDLHKYKEPKNVKEIVTDCEALKTDMTKKDVRKIANWIMELQPFDFEIIHRPGTKMKHVDALNGMFVILYKL